MLAANQTAGRLIKCIPSHSVRKASRLSAIKRGLGEEAPEGPQRRWKDEYKAKSSVRPATNHRSGYESRKSGDSRHTPQYASKEEDYVSIPYTTAASEFLYGLNVVYAALKSRRRSLYTLYLHKRAKDNASKGFQLLDLATSAGVKVRRVGDDFLPVMDKMTGGRPHNGVILECSPIPIPPVDRLEQVDPSKRQISLVPSEHQFSEEKDIHRIPQSFPAPTEKWRQPLVLLLDGILDPGNMGNILRTAYFYGVDAVAVCVNTCAPLTSATLHKAASGATEALNILAIHRPADFVAASSRNGWRVFAAVAPEASGKDRGRTARPQLSTNRMFSPLARGPSIVMLGAEGEGLRLNLKTKAAYNVVIRGKSGNAARDMGVDSLNVSAAAAVLIEAFMRVPPEPRHRNGNVVKATNQTSKDGSVENEAELGNKVEVEPGYKDEVEPSYNNESANHGAQDGADSSRLF